jgi:predicted unusual protein kinase regulating ubiquinone biosynthesis (AarF/ABC1/UbiB family)
LISADTVTDTEDVMKDTKLPEGRLTRLARMASLGARTGASLLLSDTGETAAKQALEVLGSLRGLAAKVGQMASYVDGVVPDAHRDAYEAALRGLRAAAPTSSPEQARHIVEAELGAPVTELFATWEERPFASASIGQVHRATLHDGREVAVKVQHAGIDGAVESDLRNASSLEGMVSTFAPQGVQSRRTFDEIAARFREELDYGLEARHTQEFAALHAGDPQVHVPTVIPDRSARRVITTEFVRGMTFDEAAARGPEERRVWAETLWRFVFRGTLVGEVFNADPHPGNYIFHEGGRVTFLDFGCVQRLGTEQVQNARAVHLAALRRDETGCREAVRVMLSLRGGPWEDFTTAYVRRCFEPLFASPYRITRDWVAELTRSATHAKPHLLRKENGFVPMKPGMALMNRLQFGFYSVLARLDVEADYAGVERGFLEAP